jgi:hypothetical protein
LLGTNYFWTVFYLGQYQNDTLLQQINPDTWHYYSLFAAHLDILAPAGLSVN